MHNAHLGVVLLEILWSMMLSLLAWLPRQAVRSLRRWQFGRRGLVRVDLFREVPRRPTLDAALDSLLALDALREDPMVRAVEVHLHHPHFGWATTQAFYEALERLREAGKLVLVHLDHAGNREVYLASAGDRVFMTPSGQLDLFGLGARMTFFGGALDHLGVRFDVESAGAYKSFGEPYTRSYPSAENREAVTTLLEDLQAQLIEGIAKGRQIDPAKVRDAMNLAPLSAEEALEFGLIDGAAYSDQLADHFENLLGARHEPVGWGRYARLAALERWLDSLGERGPQVAVVHLAGPILHTSQGVASGRRSIDAGKVVPVLERMIKADPVRAVVLYVDSPGGSALASDLIARAVARLASRKPVVAVFSDVAASGGYYLSAPAAEIVARSGTITGSIGVVGGKPVFGPALGRVGVTSEELACGPNAGMYSTWTPFSDIQRERFRASLRRTYDRFLRVVAGGRRRPVQAVLPAAEGRVWSGAQAVGLGLVDHIGGLTVGIERARALAGLEPGDARAIHFTFRPSRFQVLAALLGSVGSAEAPDLVAAALDALGVHGRLGRFLRAHPGEPLALLPVAVDDVV